MRVDFVVLCVRADEADINHPVIVVDPDDEAVFVTADIERHPTVAQNAGIAVIALHVRGTGPVRPGNMTVPSQ